MITLIQTVLKISKRFREHRLNASAAHSAYFIILSFIPCIILFFSLLQFTGIRKLDVLIMVQNAVPQFFESFITGIIGEAYEKTTTTISISAVATLWSAGKGMMALTDGLQWIAGIKETGNYLIVRIRGTIYTVILLASIVLFLLLGVFGNSLMGFITERFPFTAYITEMIISVKNIFIVLFAIVIFTLIYRFVPGKRMKLSFYMPGAILSALGWMLFSYAFSIYIDNFSGFSNLYGSLTTIILIMLWLYFGMYITLIGAEVNQMLLERREENAEKT